MVKRRVSLAHALTAVYVLSKPSGASKREIVKFCAQRFGIQRDSRLFESVLERAVDEGLLKVFRRRYRLSLSGNTIIWSPEKREKGCGVSSRGGRKRVVKKAKSQKSSKSGNSLAKSKKAKSHKSNTSSPRSRISSCKSVTKKSSLYKLWCKEDQKKEMLRRRKQKRDTSRLRRACGKAKSNRSQGSRKSGPVTRSQTLRRRAGTNNRLSSGTKSRNKRIELHQKRKAMKYDLRSRRAHAKKASHTKKDSQGKTNGKPPSRSCKLTRSQDDSEKNTDDFHRRILKETRQATPHAKSWDRLNHSRQKSQLENQALVKNCQLVEKILTRCHGRSWDKLNHELGRIKQARSCHKEAELKDNRGRTLNPRRLLP